MSSMIEDDLIVGGDCEDQSKRSTYKRLFLNLQVSPHGRVERIFI